MKTLTLIIMLIQLVPAGASELELGQKIYQQYCISCHAPSNIMVSSPKLGDTKDWGARLAENKTLDAMVRSAIKGKGAMPKKGRCVKCGEKEIKAAITYMMKGSL